MVEEDVETSSDGRNEECTDSEGIIELLVSCFLMEQLIDLLFERLFRTIECGVLFCDINEINRLLLVLDDDDDDGKRIECVNELLS